MFCVFLTVSFPGPVPPDDPVIDGGPEVLLNVGESYNLSCVSRGAKPPSMIEWLKDGLPVEGAASTTVSLTQGAHSLRHTKHTHTRVFTVTAFHLCCQSFIDVSPPSIIRRCFQTGRGWPHGATCQSSPSTATLGGTTAVWPPTWLFPPAKAQLSPSTCTVSN